MDRKRQRGLKVREDVVLHTLGDLGRSVAGLDQNISALGTQSSGDGLGKCVDTSQKRSATLDTKLELLFVDVS